MGKLQEKPARQAGVDMITDPVNQIIVEGVIPGERELSTIANCLPGIELYIIIIK